MVTLEDLTEEYWTCRRGKRTSYDMAALETDWMKNLVRLRDSINSRTYSPGQSSAFVLRWPVAREVVASAPIDRVVHQYIDSRVRPLLERYAYDDRSFSCRVGKGTLAAVHALICDIEDEFQGYTRDCWVIHLDIKSCFMSIDRALVARMADDFIRKHYRGDDIDDLRYLSRVCILHNPADNCRRISPAWMWRLVPPGKSFFTATPGKGMGIGNLYVQLFFNFLMSGFDRLFDSHGLARHGRYTDDSYAVSTDKSRLLSFVPHARRWMADHGLRLNESKFQIQHYSKGMMFTGAIVKPGRIFLRSRTIGGLHDAIHRINVLSEKIGRANPESADGLLGSLEGAVASVNAYCGLTMHFDEYSSRRKALSRLTPAALVYVSIHRDHEGLRLRKPYRKRTRLINMILHDIA